MKINPMTKVSTLKKKFKDEFGVEIKCHKGMSKGHIADDDDKVHELCTKMSNDRDFEISLNSNMKISTVKMEISNSIGFLVQVLNPDGTNAESEKTLSELRRQY